MSEHTIARWNAIPLAREEPAPASLKRPRNEDEESDDDISIASRTPSPAPEAMDIDKYDEYVRGYVREVVTVETKISPENKGFSLLTKMGWSEGQPLGLSEDGRVDPVPFQMKNDTTGIGKVTRDVEMAETTVAQRRGLDSERQQKETEDQRRFREESVARKAAVESEISLTLKAFYCSLCDKQFQTVSQYDEHTNSYAHHHKSRMKDMQANARLVPKEEVDKRKEKERRREEKELRKIAAANGIKMPKATVAQPIAASITLAPASNLGPVPAPSSGLATVAVQEPKKSGWTAMASAPTPQGGFKKSGWATVGSSSDDSPAAPSTSLGWTSSSAAHTTPAGQSLSAPGFRTGGWSAENANAPSYPPPPPPPPDTSPLPQANLTTELVPTLAPPVPVPVRTGWQQFNTSMKGRGRR